jgi:transposase-like protein
MNLIDVTREFQNDDDCLAYLESMRWPDGIRCPICGCDRISKITRKTASKNKRTRIYQCLEKTCKGQFSATNGTIFNDSHLPLTKWFMAIALIVDAKKGISAKQLQEHLGIGSYKTAWYMAHRIRKAMAQENKSAPMAGVVEVDETYIGGTAIRRFQKTPKPRAPKEMVLAMREREFNGKPGRVRYFHIPDGKRATIQPILEANLAPHVKRVYTDSSAVYDFAINETLAARHRKVNHSEQWIVPGSRIHTNTVESSFSLLKRGLIGSFHRVSIKHLHRYLSEFECRFNARKASDRFSMTLAAMTGTQTMPYAALTAGE